MVHEVITTPEERRKAPAPETWKNAAPELAAKLAVQKEAVGATVGIEVINFRYLQGCPASMPAPVEQVALKCTSRKRATTTTQYVSATFALLSAAH